MSNEFKYTPSTICRAAYDLLPPEDIDHHDSDLYIRVSRESRELMREFQYPHLVGTFVSNIDGYRWYDLPFCYDPTMRTREVNFR